MYIDSGVQRRIYRGKMQGVRTPSLRYHAVSNITGTLRKKKLCGLLVMK